MGEDEQKRKKEKGRMRLKWTERRETLKEKEEGEVEKEILKVETGKCV